MLLAALLALSAPAGEPRCTERTAIPVPLREIAHEPERWLGRCVRLQGYAEFNIFYADVAGYYTSLASDQDDRPNDGWLGLYLDRPLPRGRLQSGIAVGIVHDCGRDYEAEAAQAGPDTWVMSIGYCHYRSGLVLLSADFRAGRAIAFERQVGEAARAAFGDLDPESAALRPPAEVIALADRFLAALRAGDGDALRGMTDLWSELMPANAREEQAFRAYLLGEPGSPLAGLRTMPGDPQRIYFRERQDWQAADFGYWARWHVCFCRGPDCRGRWPISAFDATAAPTRPYLCLRALNRTSLNEAPDHVAIERRGEPLHEPNLPGGRSSAIGSTR